MYYYTYNDSTIMSQKKLSFNFQEIDETTAAKSNLIYFIGALSNYGKDQFCVNSIHDCLKTNDSLKDLRNNSSENVSIYFPAWFTSKISESKVSFVNENAPNILSLLGKKLPKKWKVNVVALGDVGRTLVVGLRLLGGDSISQIGIFDFDQTKMDRLIFEGNQIFSNFDNRTYPEIFKLNEDQVFDCDLFVFCATKAIPSLDIVEGDVRMVQFEQNSKIVNIYAKKARDCNYNGLFAVVSDPVDLLCKSAYISSNTDESGNLDCKGLSACQIRGYGLGVMNARANFYAKNEFNLDDYDSVGRAFGPHGNGLIIANSIKNYDHDLSLKLTELTQNANLEVRKLGFKPYIAPALSSGAISLINTISGNWHYSALYFDGAFIGTKNRLLESGCDWERYDFPEKLYKRLEETHSYLKEIL